MSKKKLIILFVLVFLFGISVDKLVFTNKNEDLPTELNNQKKNTRALSMMLETGSNTGVYETATRSTWPTDGYLFNSELSKCENGGKLSWDDENSTVVMTGSTSDKCYVYFDVYVPPKLSEWVIEQYGGVQGQNGIYLHNSSLTNSANDGSYRYSGANPNNYVCFGTTQSPCPSEYLYRIVGVFGESSHGVTGISLVELMMNNYATSEMLGTNGMYSSGNLYSFSDEELYAKWSTSELNTVNLNTNYINYLGTTYSNLIVTARFGDNNKKIGLIGTGDYRYASSNGYWTAELEEANYSGNNAPIIGSNWIYKGSNEWIDGSLTINSSMMIMFNGFLGDNSFLAALNVRPSFYLNADVQYDSGLGTSDNPIYIKVD